MSRSNEDLVKVISEVLDLPSESDIDPRSEPELFDVSFDVRGITNNNLNKNVVASITASTSSNPNDFNDNQSSDDEHLPTNNESGVSSLATSYVDSSSEADDTGEDPNYEPSDVGSTASFNESSAEELEAEVNFNQPSTSENSTEPKIVWSKDGKPVLNFQFDKDHSGIKLDLPYTCDTILSFF
ncbi:hypothetical protein J6590_092734 [Homalodisca vitripennis]|nr:hypothetical protein J6590_092734 [Homalodisca vitripennis]